MIKRSLVSELSIAFLVVVLSILLLDSYNWWMSNQLLMLINVLLVAVVVVFATFVWREQARDEREQLHRQMASRVAYVAGVAVLVTGVVVEGLSHKVDQWLMITLCAMVLAKIGGLIYGQLKH